MRRSAIAFVIIVAGLLATACTQPSSGGAAAPSAPAVSAAPASAAPAPSAGKPGY
jgi:hypothetical protein